MTRPLSHLEGRYVQSGKKYILRFRSAETVMMIDLGGALASATKDSSRVRTMAQLVYDNGGNGDTPGRRRGIADWAQMLDIMECPEHLRPIVGELVQRTVTLLRRGFALLVLLRGKLLRARTLDLKSWRAAVREAPILYGSAPSEPAPPLEDGPPHCHRAPTARYARAHGGLEPLQRFHRRRVHRHVDHRHGVRGRDGGPSRPPCIHCSLIVEAAVLPNESTHRTSRFAPAKTEAEIS